MSTRNAVLLVVVSLVGCIPAPAPVVTRGTFTASYRLTMQRGAMDVVVQSSGPATYVITNYPMNHPMGPRPDTEATFVTPAGTFVISDRGQTTAGLTINGTFYAEPPAAVGRSTITIDAKGVVTVGPPETTLPAEDGN